MACFLVGALANSGWHVNGIFLIAQAAQDKRSLGNSKVQRLCFLLLHNCPVQHELRAFHTYSCSAQVKPITSPEAG
jgi:hypothetical protein